MPVGGYIGVFHYQYPSTWSDETIWYKITESNKDYLLIGKTDYNGNLLFPHIDTIYITDKKIEGHISSNNIIPYFITGEWSKNNSKKSYLINGFFTQTDNTQGGVFIYSGTFEIESN